MKIKSFITATVMVLITALSFSCYQPTQFTPKYKTIPVVSREALKAFLDVNTNNIKIAFTKDEGSRTLYYVDYSSSVPHAVKLKQPAGNADSPLMDSSGNWITYYMALESGVYIQRLDSTASPILVAATGTEPHWYYSAGVTYIIYSDKFWAQKNTLASLTTNRTYKVEVTLSGTTATIGAPVEIADKPFNGGISLDGKYLCTGNSDAAFYQLDVSPALYIPINAGQQTCNPSISPDTANPYQMMFLNFSGVQYMDTSLVGAFFGSDTRQHEYIFIVNVADRIVNYMQVPSGYIEWQDPEWSNHPRFAAALGQLSGTTYDGLIVDLTAKQVLVFTPGGNKLDNTSTPSLWIGN